MVNSIEAYFKYIFFIKNNILPSLYGFSYLNNKISFVSCKKAKAKNNFIYEMVQSQIISLHVDLNRIIFE